MTLTIVRLYHDLLGTYGDQGNAEILMHRASARGISVELLEVLPGDVVPTQGDIYLLGGGEDGPQTAALELLRASGGLNRSVDAGATLFAVCAGFQLIGTRLPGGSGEIDGLGIVDAHTVYTDDPRSVGELVIDFGGELPDGTSPVMTGFENHQGLTILGPGVTGLGTVRIGVGNGRDGHDCKRPEGILCGKVFGTYMHGPAFARNPQLADVVLASAVGSLTPFNDVLAEALASERRTTLLGS
jgi:CobQ-like glutamine amidotransferase family enzyme